MATPNINLTGAHDLARYPGYNKRFYDALTKEQQRSHYVANALITTGEFEERAKWEAFYQAYFGEIPKSGEMEPSPILPLYPGKDVSVEPEIYKAVVPVSKEMARRTPQIVDRIPDALGVSASATAERIKMDIFNYGNLDTAYTTVDGTQLFAASHKDLNGTTLANSQNLFNAPLTVDSLNQAIIMMMKTPAFSGLQSARTPEYLVVSPDDKATADIILNSTGLVQTFPGISDQNASVNAKNPFNGIKLIVTNFLSSASSNKRWVLLDEPSGTSLLALWEVHPSFHVEQELDAYGGAKFFNAYFSLATFTPDWRGVVMGYS